jgi:hypothetical protein
VTLQRKTPLRADPEKQRLWQQRSRQPLSSGKRLKPMSDKRRGELPERARVRELVFQRDGYRCQIAPLVPEPCFGPLTYHHLQKEGQGGAYTEANGIAACSFHNDWVEDHPDKAAALGLVIR